MPKPNRGRGDRGNTSEGRGKSIIQHDEEHPSLHKLQDRMEFKKGKNSSQRKKTAKEALESEAPYFFPNTRTVSTVLILNPGDEQWMTDPWELKKRYFDTQQYAAPDGRHKYIYEAMLTETGSVEIFHTKSQPVKNSPIAYSKGIIKRFIQPNEWGLNLNLFKKLSLPGHSFNYWDYISAWEYAFFYQNSRKKHTWFFKICPQSVRTDFPNWVLSWWDKFGPGLEILPEPIKNLYLPWRKFHPQLRGMERDNIPIGLSTLLFFTEFEIPWIWKWDFQCGYDNLKLPILQRSYSYKWWGGLPIEGTVADIQQKTQIYMDMMPKIDKVSLEEQSLSLNPFEIMKRNISKKYPGISEPELRKKCMEYMKNQFMASFGSSSAIPEDASMASLARKHPSPGRK